MRTSTAKTLCLIFNLKRFYHKFGMKYLFLFSGYAAYILVFAVVFHEVESKNSNAYQVRWEMEQMTQRKRFIAEELLPQIFNNSQFLIFIHKEKSQHFAHVLDKKLSQYENEMKARFNLVRTSLTFTNSFIYISSIVTTNGSGDIVPMTRIGKYVSICCAIFGIPLTVILIKNLAYLITKILNYPSVILVRIWSLFRYCTLQTVDEDELVKKIHGEDVVCHKDYRIRNIDYFLDIPITVAILAIIGWIVLGCFAIHIRSPLLETPTLIYSVFNAITTIGFSNIVHEENSDDSIMLTVLFVYLIFGLAIISLFINLLHTKLSKVYWLPGKLYLRTPNQNTDLVPRSYIASFDSMDDLNFISDCPLNHYVTLGVLETQDKCPILSAIRKERAYVDANTLTSDQGNMKYAEHTETQSAEALLIKNPITSSENVNDLIIETYS